MLWKRLIKSLSPSKDKFGQDIEEDLEYSRRRLKKTRYLMIRYRVFVLAIQKKRLHRLH